MDQNQINNIYINCNRQGVDMEYLLSLCLDPDSGITVEGLKAVNYKKIDQLEARYRAEAEDLIWARSQNSVDALTKYIKDINQGVFSDKHLAAAQKRLRELVAAREDKEWMRIDASNNLNEVLDFIDQIKNGTYSDHYLQDAQRKAEFLHWNTAKNSGDSNALNAYIEKCNSGFYPVNHLGEARDLLEQWEAAVIIEDWNRVLAEPDIDARIAKIDEFVRGLALNNSNTANTYRDKAAKERDRLGDEKEARKDWIDASQQNDIRWYADFIAKHPYSEYREEADRRIQQLKGDLLSDMKRYPFKYDRSTMYQFISTNTLTMADLVDKSYILTDRAYSHIKRFPQLTDEQSQLPLSSLENPTSEKGNTDVYFFGVPGSGKTCVLAGLMSLTGQLGFRFDPKGPGGGGNYAMELRRYARESTLPPGTYQEYVQVIDCEIKDQQDCLHKISLIEMSGEKTSRFAAMDNPSGLGDLGPGAEGLLLNDNPKLLFFVIDPTNEKDVEMGTGSRQWVMQSDVLNCISSLLSKNKDLMKKVVGIHVILTKSDTLGDYVSEDVIRQVLKDQGYAAVLEDIKNICEKYDINKQTGFQVGIYPFCVGKFMPGDVYTLDGTDSLKILRVIQANTEPIIPDTGFFKRLSKWFNS